MRIPARATLGLLAALTLLTAASGPARAEDFLQCVPFARMASGIEIFGDAWTWWKQSTGKYAQGFTPTAGSVLVFKRNGVMRKGHVAVVSQVLTDRVIQVSHANWSIIDGGRGQVEKDVTVVDVSQAGDWSKVKVWFDPAHDLGQTIYPTYGFIYQSTQMAARAVAQTAMSQIAAAAPTPGAGAVQMLNQAAGSTDRIASLLQTVASSGDGL